MLEQTLDRKRSLFEPLIIEIVREGIVYRQKKADPLTIDEVDELNSYIFRLGFKFPDLYDPTFRASLPRKGFKGPAQDETPTKTELDAGQPSDRQRRSEQLAAIKSDFFALFAESNRNAAGLALEKILNRLFAVYDLSPRQPFRVTGEQIDGSFELDHDVYLVEAKWEKEALPEAPLLVFRGKIEGKSAYTRSVFFALHNISEQAKKAITIGKQATFFVIDGYDLTMILSEDIRLDDYLRQRRRLLAEEGLVIVPYQELRKGSRDF